MDYETMVEKARNKLNDVKNAIKKGIVMSFKVNTVKDERVCADCKKHEGHTDIADKAEIGINHPPFHDGCRCFATYEIVRIVKSEER